MKVALVAVENVLFHFDMLFSYAVYDELADSVVPGVRVIVPFGNGNRKRQGIVTGFSSEPHPGNIKPVASVIDKTPVINEDLIELGLWLKKHTFSTYFDALRLMLPTGMNIRVVETYTLSKNVTDELISNEKKPAAELLLSCMKRNGKPFTREKIDTLISGDAALLYELTERKILQKSDGAVQKGADAVVKMVRLSESSVKLDSLTNGLTPKQKQAVEFLLDAECAAVKEICYFTGVSSAVIAGLCKKGVLEYYEAKRFRNPYEHVDGAASVKEISLTIQQQLCYENLLNEYKDGAAHVSLLYGVTGSGKTSVFMKLIDTAIADGKNVIVMVPEISLTPQTLGLFHSRYGKKVAVVHSGLSIGERMDEWQRIKNGDVQIAIGTRSAVFAPLGNIGLIIMDEEQEHTYKSESSPRYHAREAAKFRCGTHKALLVLCSATPSVESFYFAQTGRYSYNEITERYGNAVLPDVMVVDMREELIGGNSSVFSEKLFDALKYNLDNKHQSILLINRRGYNTYITCKACGYVADCPNCSITLTYHKANNRLMCHYCGHSVPYKPECPECGEQRLKFSGIGTQRAEDELSRLLPDAKILRMDTDTTVTRNSYDKKLNDFKNREYDIMLGTQMVAKGLDFPDVTLVGVLSADQSLLSDEFRAFEKAFALFTQVVGRSGRGDKAGIAVIQTVEPEHEIIALAAEQDYKTFFENEIIYRKNVLYPPFADVCFIGFVGENEDKVKKSAQTFLQKLADIVKNDYPGLPLRAIGPSPAQVSKVANQYRHKLILKCKNNNKTRDLLERLLTEHGKSPEYRDVTVYIDMNP